MEEREIKQPNEDDSINGNTNEKDKITKKSLTSFALISCITGLLALGAFMLLMYVYGLIFADADLIYRDVAVFVAEYISVIISCLFSFSLNKRLTFSDRNARRAAKWLYVLYYFVVTPFYAWFMVSLINAGVPDFVAKLIKMTINLFTDFLYCRYFLFRYLKRKYLPETEEGQSNG